MQNVFDILQERNYIEQMTHPEQMKEMFSKESVPFYIGIDPTADSLHVGHFVSLMVASHMQKCGHKPIILMGGGTAIIGDPSGKTDMRKMLTKEDIEHNVACIKKQVEKFVSFEGENAAIIVNNADWLCDLKYIDFMREANLQSTKCLLLIATKIEWIQVLHFLKWDICLCNLMIFYIYMKLMDVNLKWVEMINGLILSVELN